MRKPGSPYNILFYLHDANRSFDINGKAISPLIDGLKERLIKRNYRFIDFKTPGSRLEGLRRKNDIVLSMDKLIFCVRILRKILKVFFSKTAFDPMTFFFKWILLKYDIDKIIGIGLPMHLCKAANELKIHSAELLHGMGYILDPWGWNKINRDFLPHTVFALDSISEKTFKKIQNRNLNVKKIPHPFYTLKNKLFLDQINIYKDYLNNASKNYTHKVVYSLQWSFEPFCRNLNFSYPLKYNDQIFITFLKLLKRTKATAFWFFRLHPVQLRDKNLSRNLVNNLKIVRQNFKNFDWEICSAAPLTSCAHIATEHITYNSMTAYDLAYFGIPTFAFAPTTNTEDPFADLFPDLIESKIVHKGSLNEQEIYKWIHSPKKNFRQPPFCKSWKNFDQWIER